MSRELDIGSKKYTRVVCVHEDDVAPHQYSVEKVAGESGDQVTFVSFQNGPIKENGVNGCHNEDLLAMVIDRLRFFQEGQYRCRENALAITKIEEALHWLRHRTTEREKRGVEGTSTV